MLQKKMPKKAQSRDHVVIASASGETIEMPLDGKSQTKKVNVSAVAYVSLTFSNGEVVSSGCNVSVSF